MAAVVALSALVRLSFYIWWRARFGGRPLQARRPRSTAPSSAGEVRVLSFTNDRRPGSAPK
ncbi:hypothetical protein BH11PLA1_BH11PLA1_12060 [soil metagenome]